MKNTKTTKGLVTTIALVIALIVILIIAVFASRKATPGQFLYPTKQASEKVELWLTFGHEAKANARFKLMEIRTKELVHEVNENDFDDAIDESEDFREALEEANEDIKEVAETGKNTDSLQSKRKTLVENELTALNDALSKAPEKYKSDILKEISLIQEAK